MTCVAWMRVESP